MLTMEEIYRAMENDPRTLEEIIKQPHVDKVWGDFIEIFFQHSTLAANMRLRHMQGEELTESQIISEMLNQVSIFKQIEEISLRPYQRMERALEGIKKMIDLIENAGDDVSWYQEEYENMSHFFYSINTSEFLWVMEDELKEMMASRQWKRAIQDKAKKFTEKIRELEIWMKTFILNIESHFDRKEKRLQKERQSQIKREQKQIKELNKKNSISVAYDNYPQIPVWLLDKIGAREKRVENILVTSQERWMSKKMQDELVQIAWDLDELLRKTNFPELIERIHGILNVIELIRSTKKYVDKQTQEQAHENNIISEQWEENDMVPSEKNLAVIAVFEKILKNFDHGISSTKNKDESYGDGSFVVKIFRPFIKGILNEVFLKNKIQLWGEFSWSEVIKIYEEQVDNKDRAQNHFYGILKNSYKKCNTIQDFFVELWNAIEIFSLSDFFKKWKEDSLRNVLKKFHMFLDVEFSQK